MKVKMRKSLAVLLIVVFVWVTLFLWFPPTYQVIVGWRRTGHGDIEEPIYATRLEPKNFLLNLLPWVFFAAYLLVPTTITKTEGK